MKLPAKIHVKTLQLKNNGFGQNMENYCQRQDVMGWTEKEKQIKKKLFFVVFLLYDEMDKNSL